MKQHLLELARNLSSQSSNWNARNLVREYLQARILEGLVRAGAMASVAFMGGTALRFLFGLQRYSEDLDFSLEGNRENYDPQRWTEKLSVNSTLNRMNCWKGRGPRLWYTEWTSAFRVCCMNLDCHRIRTATQTNLLRTIGVKGSLIVWRRCLGIA